MKRSRKDSVEHGFSSSMYTQRCRAKIMGKALLVLCAVAIQLGVAGKLKLIYKHNNEASSCLSIFLTLIFFLSVSDVVFLLLLIHCYFFFLSLVFLIMGEILKKNISNYLVAYIALF